MRNEAEEQLQEILRVVEEKIGHSERYSHPSKFILDIYAFWKLKGGKTPDGKPLHSVRFLSDKLKDQNIQIRSLTPKLYGTTNIRPSEGRDLLSFLLSNWPDEEGGIIKYTSLLSAEDLSSLLNFIESQMDHGYTRNQIEYRSNSLGEMRAQHPDFDDLPGRPIVDVLSENYEQCDVQITVSPEHSLTNPQPGAILIGFRDLMNLYWGVEQATRRKRPLVWILESGNRRFDDQEAREKYYRVKQLAIRLNALREFEDKLREERWEWLRSVAVFVIHDDRNEPSFSYKASLPPFSASDISFRDFAREWILDNNFRTLYGKGLEEVRQRTFSVVFNTAADWSSDPESEEQIRYFGFAAYARGDGRYDTRGLELPPLPLRYHQGFTAVCVAAKHKLGLNQISPEKQYAHQSRALIDSNEAVGQLERLGYSILTLDEFLQRY